MASIPYGKSAATGIMLLMRIILTGDLLLWSVLKGLEEMEKLMRWLGTDTAPGSGRLHPGEKGFFACSF